MHPEPHCPGVTWTLEEIEHHVHRVGKGENHSEAIVRAVAALTNQNPLEMTPIASVIDPDGLQLILDANSRGSPICVEFEYSGCFVVANRSHVWVGKQPE